MKEIVLFLLGLVGLASPQGYATTHQEAPMEIVLTFSKTLALDVTLQNHSETAWQVLCNSILQPIQLTLTDSSGKIQTPFDERTRSKIDRSVSKAMFAKILPLHGQKSLASEPFQKQPDGTYSLAWGPYRFSGLAAGSWTAKAELNSTIDEITISQTGESQGLPGVWKGRLQSNTVKFDLPNEAMEALSAAREKTLASAQDQLKNFLKAHHMEAEFWQTPEGWQASSDVEHRVISPHPNAPIDQRFERRETFPGAHGFMLTLSVAVAPIPISRAVVNEASGKIRNRTVEGGLPQPDHQWLIYHLNTGSDLDDSFIEALLDCLRGYEVK